MRLSTVVIDVLSLLFCLTERERERKEGKVFSVLLVPQKGESVCFRHELWTVLTVKKVDRRQNEKTSQE